MIRKSTTKRAPRDAAAFSGYELPPGWSASQVRGIPFLRAAALERIPWLVHGFSTRIGGVSHLGNERVLSLGNVDWDKEENVLENRKRFLAALGAAKLPLVILQQRHTDILHAVTDASEEPLRGDGMLTITPGLLLAVKTADCVPILLADTKRRAVAAVHAGWRGTLARIAEKAVGRMQMEFGTAAADLVAVLGPSIGRCCYQVGPEVARAFGAQFSMVHDWFDGPFEKVLGEESPNPLPWLTMTPPGHDALPPSLSLDLVASLRWQLVEAGVPGEQVFTNVLCTRCHGEMFFSHRGEKGKTGRMMAVIGIREASRPGRR